MNAFLTGWRLGVQVRQLLESELAHDLYARWLVRRLTRSLA